MPELPRGCGTCHRDVPIRRNGTTREHRRPVGGGRPGGVCEGSARRPLSRNEWARILDTHTFRPRPHNHLGRPCSGSSTPAAHTVTVGDGMRVLTRRRLYADTYLHNAAGGRRFALLLVCDVAFVESNKTGRRFVRFGSEDALLRAVAASDWIREDAIDGNPSWKPPIGQLLAAEVTP